MDFSCNRHECNDDQVYEVELVSVPAGGTLCVCAPHLGWAIEKLHGLGAKPSILRLESIRPEAVWSHHRPAR